MSSLQLPQGGLLINGFKPQTNAGIITGDYISLKTAHRVFVVFHVNMANATQPVLSLMKTTAVLPAADAVAVTATFPIWYNLDCDTDIMTRAAANAATYTLDIGTKTKLVVFQVDPSILDAFDCLAGKVAASSASNIIGCTYIIENRYKQATPPSVIID